MIHRKGNFNFPLRLSVLFFTIYLHKSLPFPMENNSKFNDEDGVLLEDPS